MMDDRELAGMVERLRLQHTDDGLVEVKACARQLSSDIWETVSAFANTSGGHIVLGLDEKDGFVPVEHFELNRVLDQFIAGMGDGGQQAAVAPIPRYEVSRHVVDGAPVLVIRIFELDMMEKPCYIRARGIHGGSYKRIDDKDVRLSAVELYEMQNILRPSDADGEAVPEATVDDLDTELVEAVIVNRSRQSARVLRGAQTREQQLERLNITNKAGGIRLAGLFAVGLYPQQYYPKLVIDVAAHPGNEKSQPGAPRFLDRRVCDGALSACIEEALAAIGRNLRSVSRVEGAVRRDEWELPEEVLREVLANAVIHREYAAGFLGQAVSVDVYQNRIEVVSPGGLWGGKTVDNLGNGDSRCRNAKLMNLMGAVPLEHGGGYVAESQGSGIATMVREMEARGLPAPRFMAKPDSFKVVLMRPGTEAMGLSAPVRSNGFKPAGCADASAPAMPRTPSELRAAILALMTDGGTYRSRELAEKLGAPIAAVRYALSVLVDSGSIVPTAGAKDRNRAYHVA